MIKIRRKFPKSISTRPQLQTDPLECGAVSLSIILDYYGKYVSLAKLRELCGVSRNGAKASAIVKSANRLGLAGKGYSLTIEKLKDVKPPAIIFVDLAHFVVYEGFKNNRFLINDPGGGRMPLRLEAFERRFSGVALTFEPTDKFVKTPKPPGASASLRKLTKGARPALFLLSLISIFAILPGLVVPSLTKIFIDNYLVEGQRHWGTVFLFACAGLIVIQTCMMGVQQFVGRRVVAQLGARSAAEYVWSLLRLPIQFYSQRSPGNLAGRIGIAGQLGSMPSQLILPLISASAGLFFFGIIMMLYSPLLTAVTVATSIVSLVALLATQNKLVDLNRTLTMDSVKTQGKLLQGFSMGESLKVNGLGDMFFQNWSGNAARVINGSQALGRLQALLSMVPETVQMLGRISTLVVGTYLVLSGEITIGTILAFMSLQQSFYGPVASLQATIAGLSQAKATFDQIEDVTEERVATEFSKQEKIVKEQVRAASALGTTDKLPGTLEILDLTFGFNVNEPPQVKNVSLKVKSGGWLALVGTSGSGKSTLGLVASGLEKPWSGGVHIGGIPLEDIPRRQLRASLAVVNQNIFLIEGTIAQNISMWDDTMPEDVMVQAARDAEIHDLIAGRPGGYQNKLMEGGVDLSGGQRQRLEIARALALQPSLLILDEATSALDPIVERRVIENIKRRGCTCLVIAHRLSTIRDCDEIIVLEKGNIRESGTHESLLSAQGLYAQMMND